MCKAMHVPAKICIDYIFLAKAFCITELGRLWSFEGCVNYDMKRLG